MRFWILEYPFSASPSHLSLNRRSPPHRRPPPDPARLCVYELRELPIPREYDRLRRVSRILDVSAAEEYLNCAVETFTPVIGGKIIVDDEHLERTPDP